jgi:trimethylamine---corrinoid protein Co-methyltransferase
VLVPDRPLSFLDRGEMQRIHDGAVRILGRVGMRFDHEGALDYLASAGCEIDRARRTAMFPEPVVEGALARLKRDYARRAWPEEMAVRYSRVRFTTGERRIHPDFTVSAGGYCVYLAGLDGVRRRATLEDTRDALRLAEQLDEIAFAGLPVSAQDVPQPMRQIVMAAELVKHTRKLGGIETLTPFDIEHVMRIGDVVRGSREELRKRPILVGYAEARSPLTVDSGMCEVMIEYVKRGMPQSLDTMPSGGATAPQRPAGVMAVGLAETLGGMVLAYAVDPEAVVTLDVTPSFADPSTGIYRYAGAERLPLLGARIQMIGDFYGCPSGVHGGKTDALHWDERCGFEKGTSMLMTVLCGAIGIGTVGHVENALTFSPVQLVLDNEMARYVRRAVQGFSVTEDDVGADLVERVGIGGNFLAEEDTAEQLREVLHLSPFFRVEPWGGGPQPPEGTEWERMASARAAELMAREVPPALTPEQEREIDAIVRSAERELAATGRM